MCFFVFSINSLLYFFESVRIYVICPASYNCCANFIVSFGDKCSSLDANCCKVEVVKGSGAFRMLFLATDLLQMNLLSFAAHCSRNVLVSSIFVSCLLSSKDKFRFVKYPITLYTSLPGDFLISK